MQYDRNPLVERFRMRGHDVAPFAFDGEATGQTIGAFVQDTLTPVPEFVTVISWDGLIVPVSCAPNVSDVGEREAEGVPVLVEEDGVQPDSEAEADVAPSLTVILQSEELYGDFWILNAPLPSLVPVTEPGSTTTE